MQRIQSDERLIRQYLLGELPELEQTAVEARYFADDAFFEQLVAAEKELIDRFVHGDLSHEDHERFQRRYLTVGYRRKLVDLAMIESAKKALHLAGGRWRRLLNRLRSFELRSRR